MTEGWIVVPNWEKFQHYSDRDPVWIKLYTGLNSDDDWLALTAAERGMLTTIWIEYARSRGRLRGEKVLQLCGKSARSKHLESLNRAGFIEISASRPLALARSRETETELPTEEDPPSIPPAKRGRREKRSTAEKNGRGKGYVDNLSQYTGVRYIRGSHSQTAVYDPLGTEPPPKGWRRERPTRAEVARALRDTESDEPF